MLKSQFIHKYYNFINWKRNVEYNGNLFQDIKILSIIKRNNNKIISFFLDCKLLTPEGNVIDRCVLINGESVVIIPLFYCLDNNEYFTLLVKQRRIIDGDYSTEFPAGSIDLIMKPKNSGCQEIKEELGLSVELDDLNLLNDKHIKINASYSDSLVNFYYFKKNVSMDYLKEFNGKQTGCNDEGEFINVVLLKIKDLIKCNTSSTIIGLKLLEHHLGISFK